MHQRIVAGIILSLAAVTSKATHPSAHERKHTTRALLAAALLSISSMASAATELSDYDAVVASPGITTLAFESGSTGFSTPPDISIVYGFSAYAGTYGDGYLQFFSSAGITPDKFGAQYLSNVSAYPRHSDITATFSGTVNTVGAWLQWAGDPYWAPIQTIDLLLYDANDQLLFSKSLQSPQAFDQLYYYGVYSDQAIARAVWHPVEDSFFVLDNLTYGISPAPVPVPAGAWLLASALGALTALRRRLVRPPRC
jgi:hypothetical protein